VAGEEWGLGRAEGLRRGLTLQPKGQTHHFIHHTAGQTPDVSAQVWDDDPIAFVQFLDRLAREQKGYKALDYSFVVHQAPNGRVTIVEGRAEFFPAATKHMNSVSKASVLAGNFHPIGPVNRRHPSEREIDALRWINTVLRLHGTLNANAVVLGHRDNPECKGCTTCPGDWLYPYMHAISQPWPSTTPLPPEPPPVAPEDDMIYLAHPTTNDPNDPRMAIYAWCGAFKVHFGDQATWRAWRTAQAARGVVIPASPPVLSRDEMMTSGVVLPQPIPGTDRWGRVLP
jgi:hypothetical protein